MKRVNCSIKVSHGLIVFLLICGMNLKARTQEQELSQKDSKKPRFTVQIICDDKQTGSGVIVGVTENDTVLVLTECHVIASNYHKKKADDDLPLEYYNVKVKMPNKEQLQARRITGKMVDFENDLALIAVKFPNFEENVDVVDYRTDGVTVQETVKAFGFPTSTYKATSGKINSVDKPNYFVFDAEIGAGSSGGPLVDEKDRMIGLVRSEEVDGNNALKMILVAPIVNNWLDLFYESKLKKRWQIEKDGSFFTNPWFIGGGLVASAGTVVYLITSRGGDSSNTFPFPIGRPGEK